jgi:hypothetical protein
MALTVKHYCGIIDTIKWKILLDFSNKVTRRLNFCNLEEEIFEVL